MNFAPEKQSIAIGVGLRHVHFTDALDTPADVDFLEVHAENFYANGGLAVAILDDIAKEYALSLHATALGLGSTDPVPTCDIESLLMLSKRVDPVLVSDHACFTRASQRNGVVHAGDLLPIVYDQQNLALFADNVDRVQERLARPILIENISAYLTPAGATLDEFEFLVALCAKTGCRILLDLNNMIVNGVNQSVADIAAWVGEFILSIPAHLVGEIHLAGSSPVKPGELLVDDHSHPVSELAWQLYRQALRRFGAVSTLIEWDSEIPSWSELIDEAHKARRIATEVLFQ